MIGVIFATLEEARPFLVRFRVKRFTKEPFTIFRAALPDLAGYFLIVISGMGKIAAAGAAKMLIGNYRVKRIIHAGICGALTDRSKINIGAVFRITRASEADRGLKKPAQPVYCAADMWQDLPGARLVTNEHPVFDSQKRNELAAKADLVDMEGVAIAGVAERYGIPCSMIKGVSDFADRGERQTLHANLPAVSERIARLLYKEVLENV